MNKWCKIFLGLNHGVVSGSIEEENETKIKMKERKF